MKHSQAKLSGIALASLLAAAAATHLPANAQSASGPAIAKPATAAAMPADYRALRTSQIVGMSVRNKQGENIGQVEDVVLNFRTGEVRYGILRFDPGIFQGEELFAVPVSAMRVAADRNDVVLAIDEERLERAAIDERLWNENYFADLKQVKRLDAAWGIGGSTAGPIVRASDVLGQTIKNLAGDPIGELEEIVINAPSSKVHYAVMEFDDNWLTPEKRVILPLTSFSRQATTGDLVLNVNQAQAAAMPAFNPRHYRNLNDRGFLAQFDRIIVMVPVASAGGAQGTQVR